MTARAGPGSHAITIAALHTPQRVHGKLHVDMQLSAGGGLDPAHRCLAVDFAAGVVQRQQQSKVTRLCCLPFHLSALHAAGQVAPSAPDAARRQGHPGDQEAAAISQWGGYQVCRLIAFLHDVSPRTCTAQLALLPDIDQRNPVALHAKVSMQVCDSCDTRAQVPAAQSLGRDGRDAAASATTSTRSKFSFGAKKHEVQ